MEKSDICQFDTKGCEMTFRCMKIYSVMNYICDAKIDRHLIQVKLTKVGFLHQLAINGCEIGILIRLTICYKMILVLFNNSFCLSQKFDSKMMVFSQVKSLNLALPGFFVGTCYFHDAQSHGLHLTRPKKSVRNIMFVLERDLLVGNG